MELSILLLEYCRLSLVINPSDAQLERMRNILELACVDERLALAINEADLLIADLYASNSAAQLALAS